MAVTKILAKRMRIDRLVKYVVNPDKTDDKVYVSAVRCDPETAAEKMLQTKRRNHKTDGVQAYHIIQSFRPDEITPELAHEIGRRFVDEYLDGYEVVIGTHVDKEHIHNHIVFNSVSDDTGKMYHSSPESYFKGIRAVSDRLCKEYGLSVILENEGKGISYAEWKMHKAGLLTYREMVNQDVTECLSQALDVGNFYALMEDRGYTVKHRSGYPSFILQGTEHPYRAKINGKSLTEDDIREIIEKGLSDPDFQVVMPKQYVTLTKHGKQHGFRALYVSWMYVLGMIGKGRQTPYRVDPEELKHFERYKRQEAFLRENGIDDKAQLEGKWTEIQDRIDTLTKTRTILNANKKRRQRFYTALSTVEYYGDIEELYRNGEQGAGEEYEKYLSAKKLLDGKDIPALQKEKNEVYSRLADINAELRRLKKELRLCEQIGEDEPKIEQTIGEESVDKLVKKLLQQETV